MCATLAGRASEQINFGKISTGALNDLEKVTKQAYALISYYGMSEKIGNLSYYDSSGQSQYNFSKPYSEKTAEIMDSEVKSIVEKQYQRALKIIQKNKDGLTQLGELLIEQEVIFAEDLEKIFGKRQWTPRSTEIEQEIKKEKKETVEENIADLPNNSSEINLEDLKNETKEEK